MHPWCTVDNIPTVQHSAHIIAMAQMYNLFYPLG